MGLRVSESGDGWQILDGDGNIVATASSNAEAWRTMERLELRERGRKGKLYQSDAATVKR